MRSTFFGLNTLLRALQTQQLALDTTNHNIANANTEGYSRQVASMVATRPYTMPGRSRPASMPLAIGTGVQADQIRRQRDAFVDLEVRQQLQAQRQWETLAAGLRQVEGIFAEPSDHSLQALISNFFNAWSELSNDPESSAVRAAVRASGESLATGFNDLGRRLEQMRQDVDGAISLKVPEINLIGAELASLNDQIMKAVGAGDVPNDLRDRRDLLLDELVKLTGATYREELDGSTSVFLGARTFVAGNMVSELATETRALASGGQIHLLQWARDGAAVRIDGGELKGQLELRDQTLPEQLRQLNLLASTLAGAVNDQHRQGFGTGAFSSTVSNFFDPVATTATLNSTGLGNDLYGGQITVNGVAVTVDPGSQTLSAVMTSITSAIGGGATWTLDGATGTISITYTSATAVTLGGPADTSNFLQLVGLLGAPDTIVAGGPPPVHRITGVAPVALVRAATMAVDQAIKNDVQAIAAAAGSSVGLTTAAGPGDNRNALAIAGLQRTALAALGSATFEEYYASTVAALGVQVRQADELSSNQALVTQHLELRRQSISGVSLDEEATRLIQYQHAYEAAARAITALDEMLETIINRMGRVGM